MSDEWEGYLEVMASAAAAGGTVLREWFGKTLTATRKTTVADLQSKADLASEAAILSVLGNAFPQVNIYSEECGELQRSSPYTFVVDPLDGTHNFIVGIPNFAISIALIDERQLVAGVIHLPMLQQTFTALRGRGAFCNGTPLRVNTTAHLAEALVSLVLAYREDRYFERALFDSLRVRETARIFTNWASTVDFTLLAQGKLDAMIFLNCELYDFAAGKLIAQEAGAVISTPDGATEADELNNSFLVTATTTLNSELVAAVAEAQRKVPTSPY